MARFYAEIRGKAGVASREGNDHSGIWSHTRGWHLGVEVYGGMINENRGLKGDCFTVYLTSGSGGSGKRKCLGTFTLEDL